MRKWLVQLDELIVPDSLEIMKLSLRSELKQVQLDGIKSAADLSNALKGVYDDEQKILSRVMYALKILGHRRYGYYALRQLNKAMTIQQIEFDSSFLPASIDRDEFCLYQCLAIVCVVLPRESNERFIKHFAKQLEINPGTVKTPCEILIKMIQAEKISCKNHENLIEEALIKSHLPDDKIKKYKNKFEEICELILWNSKADKLLKLKFDHCQICSNAWANSQCMVKMCMNAWSIHECIIKHANTSSALANANTLSNSNVSSVIPFKINVNALSVWPCGLRLFPQSLISLDFVSASVGWPPSRGPSWMGSPKLYSEFR